MQMSQRMDVEVGERVWAMRMGIGGTRLPDIYPGFAAHRRSELSRQFVLRVLYCTFSKRQYWYKYSVCCIIHYVHSTSRGVHVVLYVLLYKGRCVSRVTSHDICIDMLP